ncbi:spore germination protein [Neobacillus sp. LXY-1]|uniref:spore germination protein n=1 Tax=Neobacillus sp. LXY-1 TaxID=3379133 RepID=UPI003EE28379
MPVNICGPIQIDNVTTFAIVKFGDSLVLTPKNMSKGYAGSGAYNIGGTAIVNTGANSTNYLNPKEIDQLIADNN